MCIRAYLYNLYGSSFGICEAECQGEIFKTDVVL